jgi:hypothetical protein
MRHLSIPILGRRRLHVALVDLTEHSALHPSGLVFGTKLEAELFHLGKSQGKRDLGSGAVTNVGVMALANDFAWGQDFQTLKLANQHATGTGATAPAATDIKLQTVSTVGGQTPVAGAQSLVSAANSQAYKTIATINYTGPETVTEWGLHTFGTLSAGTGSPFTAGSATTGTGTGAALTASSSTVRGNQNMIVERTSGSNLSYGLILSNTTSVFTVPAWYLVASGLAGQAPANTETYVIRPVMFDRKTFTGIGVGSGDAIQFTYTLTITAGG